MFLLLAGLLLEDDDLRPPPPAPGEGAPQQGMVFRVLRLKQGIQFQYLAS